MAAPPLPTLEDVSRDCGLLSALREGLPPDAAHDVESLLAAVTASTGDGSSCPFTLDELRSCLDVLRGGAPTPEPRALARLWAAAQYLAIPLPQLEPYVAAAAWHAAEAAARGAVAAAGAEAAPLAAAEAGDETPLFVLSQRHEVARMATSAPVLAAAEQAARVVASSACGGAFGNADDHTTLAAAVARRAHTADVVAREAALAAADAAYRSQQMGAISSIFCLSLCGISRRIRSRAELFPGRRYDILWQDIQFLRGTPIGQSLGLGDSDDEGGGGGAEGGDEEDEAGGGGDGAGRGAGGGDAGGGSPHNRARVGDDA